MVFEEIVGQGCLVEEGQADGDLFGAVGHFNESHVSDLSGGGFVMDFDSFRASLASSLCRDQECFWWALIVDSTWVVGFRVEDLDTVGLLNLL